MPNYRIKSVEELQGLLTDDRRLLQREWDGSSATLAIQAELKRREEGGQQEIGVQS